MNFEVNVEPYWKYNAQESEVVNYEIILWEYYKPLEEISGYLLIIS